MFGVNSLKWLFMYMIIHSQTALSDCPNSVTFISSSIHSLSADVHEVLILLQLYTGQSVVDLLNSRLSRKTMLSEKEVWRVFSDVLVAVGRLHHRTKPIVHRDVKVGKVCMVIAQFSYNSDASTVVTHYLIVSCAQVGNTVQYTQYNTVHYNAIQFKEQEIISLM